MGFLKDWIRSAFGGLNSTDSYAESSFAKAQKEKAAATATFYKNLDKDIAKSGSGILSQYGSTSENAGILGSIQKSSSKGPAYISSDKKVGRGELADAAADKALETNSVSFLDPTKVTNRNKKSILN